MVGIKMLSKLISRVGDDFKTPSIVAVRDIFLDPMRGDAISFVNSPLGLELAVVIRLPSMRILTVIFSWVLPEILNDGVCIRENSAGAKIMGLNTLSKLRRMELEVTGLV